MTKQEITELIVNPAALGEWMDELQRQVDESITLSKESAVLATESKISTQESIEYEKKVIAFNSNGGLRIVK